MKILSFFILSLLFYSNSILKQNVKVTIIDNRNESLVGVFNRVSNKYSNFNGCLIINSGDSINLELISYKSITVKKIYSDTTIIMPNL